MMPALCGVLASLALSGCCSSTEREGTSGDAEVVAIVLGTAQDGGLPQVGCRCERCERARSDPAFRRRVACLGLVDRIERRVFLVDATPDFREQVERLHAELPGRRFGRTPADAILLTHAHAGHYVGLAALGRETLAAPSVPLVATPRMIDFLAGNAPFELLFRLRNVEPRPLEPGAERALTARIRVTAHAVPHREEYTETVAYEVEGPRRRLLYLPDIDRFEAWPDLARVLRRVDVALVDGTFYSAEELPGRDLREIPHPFVGESLSLLLEAAGGRPVDLRFVHLNHSNPAADPRSWQARDVRSRGARIASDGDRIPL
jgi:pyrroloquinoline quinone biosynthesis protein B